MLYINDIYPKIEIPIDAKLKTRLLFLKFIKDSINLVYKYDRSFSQNANNELQILINEYNNLNQWTTFDQTSTKDNKDWFDKTEDWIKNHPAIITTILSVLSIWIANQGKK